LIPSKNERTDRCPHWRTVPEIADAHGTIEVSAAYRELDEEWRAIAADVRPSFTCAGPPNPALARLSPPKVVQPGGRIHIVVLRCNDAPIELRLGDGIGLPVEVHR
jgi:hypothetical protein